MLLQLDTKRARRWLAGLLLLWGTLLFGGFLFGTTDSSQSQCIPTWARMASSLTLAVAAWNWSLAAPGDCRLFSALIALGMTLGLAGDLLLADLLPMPNPVPAGIAAFSLGHVGYISAILLFGRRTGLRAPFHRWGSLASCLAIGLIAWFVIVFPSEASVELRWAALGYTLLLATTAGVGLGLALQAPEFAPLALGGFLFLVSDLILAGQLFGRFQFYLLNAAVWLTYGPAQMLIVYGGNWAVRQTARPR
jgi:YhhN family